MTIIASAAESKQAYRSKDMNFFELLTVIICLHYVPLLLAILKTQRRLSTVNKELSDLKRDLGG